MKWIETDAKYQIAVIDSQLKFFECDGGKIKKQGLDYKCKDITEETIAELKSNREEFKNYIN